MLRRLWFYERQNIRFLTNLYGLLAALMFVLWIFCSGEKRLLLLTQCVGLLMAGGAICITVLVIVPHLFKQR